MTDLVRNPVADLRGASRIVVETLVGVTELVEAVHTNIARTPTRLAGAVVGGAV